MEAHVMLVQLAHIKINRDKTIVYMFLLEINLRWKIISSQILGNVTPENITLGTW
jgi:hypothetical protein